MPNLGLRDARLYGSIKSIEDLEQRVKDTAEGLGVTIASSIASNYEGAILDWIHEEQGDLDGILINPAGSTYPGEPTRHALEDTGLPVIEVHFAIPFGDSIFTRSVVGTCQGLRKHSYTAALVAMTCMLDDNDFKPPIRYADRSDAGVERPV